MKHTFTLFFCLSLSLGALAQCIGEDQHNTGLDGAWLSCSASRNPFFDHGNTSHWIIYQFPHLVNIKDIQIWNLNHPDQLNSGVKELQIFGSIDGVEWQILDTIHIDRAPGHFSYTGQIINHLTNIQSKWLMLNVLDNYGNFCAGFSEIKFNLDNVTTSIKEDNKIEVTVIPNPINANTTVIVDGLISSRLDYRIIDMFGRILIQRSAEASGFSHSFTITDAGLADGYYILHIITDTGSRAEKLLVLRN